MTNGINVVNVAHEQLMYSIDQAKAVVGEKLNPSWIKQRKVGSTTLSYIGGQTVIRLLNKAFNYQWSFEIISEEIVPSQPKVNKYAKAGQDPLEPQPPVVKVWGRLTVPGLAVKEQYGSKVLIGGASEQESAFKSASTDALKKCASLFGIGLELYGEDEGMDDDVYVTPQATYQVATPAQTVADKVEEIITEATPAPKPAPQPVQEASNATADPNAWEQRDIDRLKELKQILGITGNEQLDPYVREFLDSPDMTYYNITPQNIKAFNIFLAKKAENL